MSIELELEGAQQVQQELTRLVDRAKPLMAQALMVEAEMIMSASKMLAPVDTGVMRASGHVLPAVITRDGVEITLGYGGASEPYAVIQHENLTYRHTVGGPKFLERPLMDAMRGMAERLANAFRAWR